MAGNMSGGEPQMARSAARDVQPQSLLLIDDPFPAGLAPVVGQQVFECKTDSRAWNERSDRRADVQQC